MFVEHQIAALASVVQCDRHASRTVQDPFDSDVQAIIAAAGAAELKYCRLV